MKLIVVIIEAQSLLSTSYRILSNIILSSLIPYADEITSTDRTHVQKMHVLQSKGLRIANNAPWYVSNRQIHENSGIPFFAVTESFDSKLADAVNLIVRHLGRHEW
jgi:hypothetical protein